MRRFCADVGISFADLVLDEKEICDQATVLFHDHSFFEPEYLKEPWRGIHIIRDPRDVIVSGCFYHMHASEDWLVQPIIGCRGGLSYQDSIRALPTNEDRLLFELENIGGSTITEMIEWNYEEEYFLTVKYENCIKNVRLDEFRRIFVHLGLNDKIMNFALRAAVDNGLFIGGASTLRGGHIRDGSTGQWRKHFTKRVVERFIELFPDVLVQLGYEKNDDWTRELL